MLYHEDLSSIFRTYIKLGTYICNPSIYNKVKGRDWRIPKKLLDQLAWKMASETLSQTTWKINAHT